MKVTRGTKIKIYDTYTNSINEYSVGAFYTYIDRGPIVAVVIGHNCLSDFDAITGDEFIWGQGNDPSYGRTKYIEQSQLPLEYEKNSPYHTLYTPLQISYIFPKRNIFKKISDWIVGKLK